MCDVIEWIALSAYLPVSHTLYLPLSFCLSQDVSILHSTYSVGIEFNMFTVFKWGVIECSTCMLFGQWFLFICLYMEKSFISFICARAHIYSNPKKTRTLVHTNSFEWSWLGWPAISKMKKNRRLREVGCAYDAPSKTGFLSHMHSHSTETFHSQKVYRPFCTMKLGPARGLLLTNFYPCETSNQFQLKLSTRENKTEHFFCGLTEMMIKIKHKSAFTFSHRAARIEFQ